MTAAVSDQSDCLISLCVLILWWRQTWTCHELSVRFTLIVCLQNGKNSVTERVPLSFGGFPPNCHQTLYNLFFLNNALSTTLLSASLELRIVGYEYIYYHHDDSRLVSTTDISGETKSSVAAFGGSKDFVIYLVSQAWRSVLTYFNVIWKTASVACVWRLVCTSELLYAHHREVVAMLCCCGQDEWRFN